MSRAERPLRPLGLIGVALLGFGLALRLLLPDEPSSSPIEGALARIPMFAGAAVVLLERALRGGASTPWHWWLLPLGLIFGCFPLTAPGATRCLDFLSACVVGFALRDLVLHENMGPTIRRWLVALGLGLAFIALSQVGWQREELRSVVDAIDDPRFQSETARAFLDSDRATATLVNANAFAGLLLLMLAIAPWTRGGAWIVAILGLAFVFSGSAGATLAVLVACVIGWRHGRHYRIAAATGIAGLVFLLACVTTGLEPPLIGDKVQTFLQRLDYHALGLRMLPESGLIGAGLESTRELRWEYARPTESHSAYLHDTWLQLLVELGFAGVLLGTAALVLAWRRGRAATASSSGSPPLGFAIMFGAGVAAGSFSSPLLSGVSRILPMSWASSALLDAAILAAGICCCAAASRRLEKTAEADRYWLIGLVAFGLHGLLDYDIYTPAAATALAAFCALSPGRPRTASADRPIVGIAATILLAMPLVTGAVAMTRHAAQEQVGPPLRGLAERPEAVVEMIATLPDLDVLDGLSRRYSSRRGALVEEALEALPQAIRRWPSVRRIEAEHLARRALVDPSFRARAQERIVRIIGKREGPWRARMLAARIKIERVLGNDRVIPELARGALDSMSLWHIDDPKLRVELEGAAR